MGKIELTKEVQAAIIEFYKVAKSLPMSEKAIQYRKDIEEGNLIRCPVTGRFYESERVERLKDQIGEVLNFLHPEERKTTKGLVPVACIKCRKVVSWVKPGKDRDGFETKADGTILHIHCCPECEPDKFIGKEVGTPFIEKEIYLKHKYK